MKRLFSLLALAAIPLVSQAIEYQATVTLISVMPTIANRPAEPRSSTGFVRLLFAPNASIGPDCANTAADIANVPANRHLITQAQIARVTKNAITIWVDSTLRANGDTVCHVTVIKD